MLINTAGTTAAVGSVSSPLPHPKLSLASCQSSQSLCSVNKTISIITQPLTTPIIKPHTITQHTSDLPLCSLDSPTTIAYRSYATRALQQVNSQADMVRKSAIESGEAYQIFEAQMNSLFGAYDQQVDAHYAHYIASLHTCNSPLAAPVTFEMFP